ncbi:hypothetical protein FN846DRAFT_886019 [Sphaerosporella brunnea]|uniref:Uncharacterized protein n=1 Tax=Sphaerosporella brunnea TaxID=1250544 RepID=A0A5J5FAE1_9PEZI|nr:hypothetical protein FN846DRAFT_886019 [Sphaerosporella brunnea]
MEKHLLTMPHPIMPAKATALSVQWPRIAHVRRLLPCHSLQKHSATYDSADHRPLGNGKPELYDLDHGNVLYILSFIQINRTSILFLQPTASVGFPRAKESTSVHPLLIRARDNRSRTARRNKRGMFSHPPVIKEYVPRYLSRSCSPSAPDWVPNYFTLCAMQTAGRRHSATTEPPPTMLRTLHTLAQGDDVHVELYEERLSHCTHQLPAHGTLSVQPAIGNPDCRWVLGHSHDVSLKSMSPQFQSWERMRNIAIHS